MIGKNDTPERTPGNDHANGVGAFSCKPNVPPQMSLRKHLNDCSVRQGDGVLVKIIMQTLDLYQILATETLGNTCSL